MKKLLIIITLLLLTACSKPANYERQLHSTFKQYCADETMKATITEVGDTTVYMASCQKEK